VLQQLCQEIMAVLNDVKTSDVGTGPPNDLRHMASQTVFSVLDHLTKWVRYRLTEIAAQSAPASSASKTPAASSGELILIDFWDHCCFLMTELNYSVSRQPSQNSRVVSAGI
jgi:hypothetical protein